MSDSYSTRRGKKCVLYLRVSLERQVDGYSLEGQERYLKQWAEIEGMTVVDTYIDAGKSGKSILGRDEFQRMLDDISSKRINIDYVVVFKLSRFGRNVKDTLNSLSLLRRYGTNLICKGGACKKNAISAEWVEAEVIGYTKALMQNPQFAADIQAQIERQTNGPDINAEKLLIQAKDEGYYEVFLLELATGLRVGELMALKWNDLNFKTGELRIERQVYRIKGELLIQPPKTKAAIRTVILPPPVIEALRAYKQTVSSKWIFPSPKKEDAPLAPAAASHRLAKILDHAGCKKVRFHDLRHPYVKLKTKTFMLGGPALCS